jgi:hypothetical protein
MEYVILLLPEIQPVYGILEWDKKVKVIQCQNNILVKGYKIYPKVNLSSLTMVLLSQKGFNLNRVNYGLQSYFHLPDPIDCEEKGRKTLYCSNHFPLSNNQMCYLNKQCVNTNYCLQTMYKRLIIRFFGKSMLP